MTESARLEEPVDSDTETVSLRPYARLLTMLGEQLIKNDRIALAELIKNSYDADATRVVVDFRDFSSKMSSKAVSSIVITDNGDGMSESVVREDWLNPAASGKLDRKRSKPETRRGRRIQGEKGIGRFAIFKIGSRAVMITRAEESDIEIVLEYDLSFLDEDSASGEQGAREPEGRSKEARPRYIDEVPIKIVRRLPLVFTGEDESLAPRHGTRIEILRLRSRWVERDVKRAYEDVVRLQPISIPGAGRLAAASQFAIEFRQDETRLPYRDDSAVKLRLLFEERAVLRVEGQYIAEDRSLSLAVNGVASKLPLDESALAGLRIYRRYFANADEPRDVAGIECGPFRFRFYVFDFEPTAAPEYALEAEDKQLIRSHRIYLYRDGVRVLPYGDPDDDWLQLDIIRGTQGARQALSNDQAVGFVDITQSKNPLLRDKTNREGLIETGRAYSDLVALLQIAVAHIRSVHFAQYRAAKSESREHERARTTAISQSLAALKANPSISAPVRRTITAVERDYTAEHAMWTMRTARMEDLAGVGLSVEAASHDIVAAASRALAKARVLSADFAEIFPGNPRFEREFVAVAELLTFVVDRLGDVQGLFVSTRQRRQRLSVVAYLKRVQSMFGTMIAQSKVRIDIELLGPVLKALSTEAALLQVLINLFDNSIYWLEAASVAEPTIRIVVDGNERRVIFGDNGPGVRQSDAPYIFEPFYSGKGEEGKGLGLYIARQLGLRMGFKVELLVDADEKVLPGANFVLDFDEGT